ncbi:DUF2069 domain-containing protein [Salinicola halophilus]|uniref:DUF2069 domain-containing protein n=1 Tax=Salinicola halophilus TaxID=184065 RepID=UPI000DA24423|nr:DUF2069 domain-containing protein [Salinicola halophilus]
MNDQHRGEQPSAASGLTESVASSRRQVRLAYVALLALLVASGVWHYVQGHADVAALVVRALPLVLFLPTLLLERRRGHIWLTALGVLYVVQGLLIVSEGGHSWLVFAEIIAAIALSVTAFYYVRRRGRLDRSAS